VGDVKASLLDRRVRIERPLSDEEFDGAGSGSWHLFCECWANIQDMLPSRMEREEGGVNMAARPARVRIRYREGVTADMRFVWGARVMQIVSGPAEIGRRDAMEFMVEDYRPAGNAA
jgi:head-tail adaptor